MNNFQLHKVHISILYALRHAGSVRFSALMNPTGLQSDTFKFYLRKLTGLGYVVKKADGSYCLSASGKEFANNLDEQRQTIQRQPKLSVLIIAPKPGPDGERLILFQRRIRNPFYGFWGLIGGPVQWGEDIEHTALHELKKQTGLSADITVRSFYRTRDYKAGSHGLLEDKLFVIVEAGNTTGKLLNTWGGGYNQWMTAEQFHKQDKHFESTAEIIRHYPDLPAYSTHKVRYEPQDY